MNHLIFYSVEERYKRNKAINIFMSEENNRKSLIEMIESSPTYYLSKLDYESNYASLLPVIEKISKLRSGNPYPNQCKEGEFVLGRFEISKYGFFLSVLQVQNKKWKQFKKNVNVSLDSAWSSLSIYIPDNPDESNATSWKEALWQTASDFCILWCESNEIKL